MQIRKECTASNIMVGHYEIILVTALLGWERVHSVRVMGTALKRVYDSLLAAFSNKTHRSLL